MISSRSGSNIHNTDHSIMNSTMSRSGPYAMNFSMRRAIVLLSNLAFLDQTTPGWAVSVAITASGLGKSQHEGSSPSSVAIEALKDSQHVGSRTAELELSQEALDPSECPESTLPHSEPVLPTTVAALNQSLHRLDGGTVKSLVCTPPNQGYNSGLISCPFLRNAFGSSETRINTIHLPLSVSALLGFSEDPTSEEAVKAVKSILQYHGLHPDWTFAIQGVSLGQEGGNVFDALKIPLKGGFYLDLFSKLRNTNDLRNSVLFRRHWYEGRDVKFNHNHTYKQFLPALKEGVEKLTLQDLINLKFVIARGRRENAIGWFSSAETENIFLICGGSNSRNQHTVKKETLLKFFNGKLKECEEFEPNVIRVPGTSTVKGRYVVQKISGPEQVLQDQKIREVYAKAQESKSINSETNVEEFILWLKKNVNRIEMAETLLGEATVREFRELNQAVEGATRVGTVLRLFSLRCNRPSGSSKCKLTAGEEGFIRDLVNIGVLLPDLPDRDLPKPVADFPTEEECRSKGSHKWPALYDLHDNGLMRCLETRDGQEAYKRGLDLLDLSHNAVVRYLELDPQLVSETTSLSLRRITGETARSMGIELEDILANAKTDPRRSELDLEFMGRIIRVDQETVKRLTVTGVTRCQLNYFFDCDASSKSIQFTDELLDLMFDNMEPVASGGEAVPKQSATQDVYKFRGLKYAAKKLLPFVATAGVSLATAKFLSTYP